MIKSKVRLGPGSDSDLILCYNAAARRALRIRRELSILSRCSGVGGDWEKALSDLANSIKAMDATHEELKRMARTRLSVPYSPR